MEPFLQLSQTENFELPAYRILGKTIGRITGLILFFSCLFTIPLARQRLFNSTALAGLQVEGVAFHFLNNVFLLHFALKTAQCILKRLAFLHANLCQMNYTSKHPDWVLTDYVTFEVWSQA
jgi:hypothetical protein